MSNRDQHIVQSLRRWIHGDMDRDTESRLDREAREDRFLEEALEGYRQFPERNHQERLDKMREKLLGQPQGRKRSPILLTLPYKIAAAAAVVLAIGLFWWLAPNGTNELAEVEKQESQAIDQTGRSAVEAPVPVLEEQITGEETAVNSKPAESLDMQATTTPGPTQPSANTETVVEATSARREQIAGTEQSADSAVGPSAAKKSADGAPNLAMAPQSRAITDSNKAISIPPALPPRTFTAEPTTDDLAIGSGASEALQGTRLITGTVVDRSGTPLDQVMVLTPGEQAGTITGQNGKYEILLDSTARELEFRRSGYAAQQVEISQAAGFLPITLKEEEEEMVPALDEIALKKTGSSASRTRVNPNVEGTANTLDLAEPIIGFRRFNRYLRQGLRYPQVAIQQGLGGAVTLSFTVLSDGSVSDVRVLQTPGAGLEQEAIRLLINGPKWKITEAGSESVNLSYRFDFTL